MRQAVIVASALFLTACGPDPNAKLPGQATQAQVGGATGSGGSGPSGGGGVVGTGGMTPAKGGSGGGNPFVGGTTGSTGGVVSSGGVASSGGKVGSGGVASSGGVMGSGGQVGSGGVMGSGGMVGSGGVPGTGGGVDIDGGGGSEPCVPAKTVTGGQTGNFGTTGAFCFRTAENIAGGWGCSSFTGRTVKVNGIAETCGAMPLPAKVNGYYYFDSSAGTGSLDYAAIYWY